MLLGIVISVGTIISIAAVGIRWLVKHYFDEIKKELKPNSGSSIKDQVTRLEKEMAEAQEQRKEANKKIDHMYDLLIEYIAKSSKAKSSTTKTTKKSN